MRFDRLASVEKLEGELPDNKLWAVCEDEFLSRKFNLVGAFGGESAGRDIQSISEASDKDRSNSREKTVMAVNGSNDAEGVTDDFSYYEAILIWLCLSLVIAPIAYTFGKITRNSLFGPNEKCGEDKDGEN